MVHFETKTAVFKNGIQNSSGRLFRPVPSQFKYCL